MDTKGQSQQHYYNSHSNNILQKKFRFTSNNAYINLKATETPSAIAQKVKGAAKAVLKEKGGGCKGKDGKVGKAGKGGKCPDWAPPRGELQSTAIKAKENVEGFYVHPELVKPILESNLKKVALQKWKNAERLTDDQFEKLIDRFEKHPAKPQNYLPKKICIAESVKRRFERVKALKIPWTPPFEGPNPIDCKPMEPEKPTCCACQPHPEARAAGVVPKILVIGRQDLEIHQKILTLRRQTLMIFLVFYKQVSRK